MCVDIHAYVPARVSLHMERQTVPDETKQSSALHNTTHDATHCNTLQHKDNTGQHTAQHYTRCNTLQHAATQ